MIIDSQNQQPAVNVYPSGNGGGMFGAGDNMFGGAWIWIIILFFFAMMMGWGNNNGNSGNNGTVTYIPYGGMGMGCGGSNYVQQGFDQAAIMSGLNGINSGMATGFANAEVSRCNQQANLLATINGNQNATIAALNNQAMALQNCCCENRASVADLKYTVSSEACNDRSAVKDALYDITAQNNANMNAMANMFNNGINTLRSDFFQYQMSCKDDKIADLQRQLSFSNTAGLVNSSRDAILANNDLQTAALEQYLAPVARPAYIVQNPNCCAPMSNYNSMCNNGCRQCG